MGIDAFGGGRGAAVASGEDADGEAVAGEQIGEEEDDGGLARPAGGEAADRDDGVAEAALRRDAAVAQGVFGGYGGGVERDEGE